MRLADRKPDLILAFLNQLQDDRHNAVCSRNLRLTSLRAFVTFAGRRDVASLHDAEQVRAVPMKRYEPPTMGVLTRPEMKAVPGQPGASWSLQRDHLHDGASSALGSTLGRGPRVTMWRDCRVAGAGHAMSLTCAHV
jgi:hypothetical protein